LIVEYLVVAKLLELGWENAAGVKDADKPFKALARL